MALLITHFTSMETQPSVQQAATAFYKWAIGVLLSVVGFFLIMTYTKLSTIDTNVQLLITSDAVNKNKIEQNSNRINSLEAEVKEVKRDVLELQKKQP